jgi:hypothetical protein
MSAWPWNDQQIPADAHPPTERPTETGWYECWAIDDRWNGEMAYRAFGNGLWWTPLKDGWLSAPDGTYHWRGPVADVNGPAPDGTNPS